MNKILLLISGMIFYTHAFAQPISAAENYARNRAGVVMVKTELSAIVNVSQLQINDKAFNRLVDSIQQLKLDSIRLTADQKLDIVLDNFLNNASSYFKSTLSYFRYNKKIISMGTGFFIRGDGYVVTNCHVVDEDDVYIRRRLISSVFRQVTASNIKAIENSWGVNFSDSQREELSNTFAGIYSRVLPISLDSLKKSIYIVMSGDETNGSYKNELPASLIVKGRSMPGKDVAILKVDAAGEFPTLKISDNPNVRVGERVLAYGFPETVTNNEYLSRSTALEPTLTNGIVSALKRTILNWPVIQMDASINHGNSGGPVCNEEGEVVGVTTFGSLERATGGLAAGFNFAIPVSVLREFFKMADIVPEESRISLQYKKALACFNRGYFQQAIELFSAIREKYPAYPGISYYLEESRLNILNKKDKEPHNGIYLFLIAGVLLAVIILTVRINLKKS